MIRLSLVLLCVASTSFASAQSSSPRRLLAEPSLSPDNAEVAFSSGGDIWTAPAAGGDAHLLISHPAHDSRPLFSPDGKSLAFMSTRTGNGDIYILTLSSGVIRRLTFDDGPEQLDAWSADGAWIYFSSTSRDISGMNDVYRVRATGGTAFPVAGDRYAAEYWGAPAADGSSIAITARGITAGQWWRHGHSHLDQSQIWLVHTGATPKYEPLVTSAEGKHLWPMWGSDGKTIYYVSDAGGAENIWKRSADGTAARVSSFRDGRVLWPQIARDGSRIVFERDYRVWSLDVTSGAAREVEITLKGATASPGVERLTVNNAQLQDAVLSPDGAKVAYTVRGEIFAAPAKAGGDGERVTTSVGRELQLTWSPDSRKLAYVANRDGVAHIYLYDFAKRVETKLTDGPGGEVGPRFSPDGTRLVYERGGRELVVMDLAKRTEVVVARGYFLDRLPFVSARSSTWSPDGKWIAFLTATAKQFSAVHVVSASGGEVRQVSYLPNVFGSSVVWSPDGKYLLFDTSQRTEPGQVARVDLVPRTPVFREDTFRDLFREEVRPPAPARPPNPAPATTPAAAPNDSVVRKDSAATAKSPPVSIVWEDVRRRLSLIPLGVDAQLIAISPDGKSLLVLADAAGQLNYFVWSLDELATTEPVARQLTSTAAPKSSATWSPDSKEIHFLEGGRLSVVNVESRQVRAIPVTAAMDVDFESEKASIFREAWTYLRDNFADSSMNGADWNSVNTTFGALAQGARTGDELRRVMSLMVGELNASHLGIGAPLVPNQATVGKLGLSFNRDAYESTGKFLITEVLPLSPAAIAGVSSGATLTSINGATLTGTSNLDSLLANTIGKRVTLGIASGGTTREHVVRPVNTATDKSLRYRAWVEERRAYVGKVSNGRLGYVHIADMSAQALAQLNIDLDSEMHGREGVVIDVRNNNGGFVNAYALDVFARRGYMTMTYRGGRPAPARTVLGQRALELPTILVTNQHSLSDAEDFTEGYRALGLGKVVGEPTAGWIIYTSGATLLDGSFVRIPFITIRGADGKIMEGVPRPVDILVERPVGESYTGRDSQLDRAVEELLKQIGRKTETSRDGGRD